jgi:hypothetical protein
MDLASIGYLYAMQAVELGKKGVWVFLDVVVVVLEDLAEKLVFGVVDSLDDVLVVAGEVEKAAALAWRAQFGKNVFACERHEVICRIELEGGAKMAEDPWCVVLELKVVLGRGSKLVTSSVRVSVSSG